MSSEPIHPSLIQINCNFCERDEFEVLDKRVQKMVTTAGVVEFQVTEGICKNCGLVYQNPLPTQNFLDNYYESKFYFTVANSDFDMQKRMDLLKKFSGDRKSLFELGSGNASFLKEASQKGFETYGFEPTKGAESIETVEQLISQEKEFEIIVSNHVLEHITDPLATLTQMNKLLANEGMIFFEVPNLEAFPRDAHSIYPEHLYQFHPDNLKALCQKAGFEVLHTEREIISREFGFVIIAKKTNKSIDVINPENSSQNKQLYLQGLKLFKEKKESLKELVKNLVVEIDDSNSLILFWGANAIFNVLLDEIPRGYHKNLYLVDKSFSKQGKPFYEGCDVLVNSPASIEKSKFKKSIICATTWESEIRNDLYEMGFNPNEVMVAPF